MTKRRKQAGAVATVTLFGVFTRLIAFLFKIYLSRTLGAEALGLYQIALSVFFLFASLSSSGVPLIVGRKVAQQEALGKKSDFSLFTSALLYATGLSLSLVIVLTLFGQKFSFLFSEPLACPVFLIMVPALLSTAVYCVVRGWFWGKKMFTAFSFTETLEETLRILFSVLFLSGILGAVYGAKAIAYAFTVSDIVVAAVLLLIFFLKGGTLQKPAPLKEIFLPALPITAMRLSASVFATLLAMIFPARLITAGFSPTEATEAFGRITGMANPLLFVPTTVTGSLAIVLLPDISALAVKKDKGKLISRINFGVNFALLISGLFAGIYFVLGEKMTLFLYGDAQSGQYLSAAAFSMLPMCLAQMTQSILNSIGKEKETFFSYLAGNLIMLLFIFFLPKYCGINAVAIATTISFSVDGIFNCILLNKHVGWGKDSVKFIVLSLLFAALSALFASSFLPLFTTSALLVCLFVVGSAAAVSYILLCFAAGLVDVNLFLSFYRKKRQRSVVEKR